MPDPQSEETEQPEADPPPAGSAAGPPAGPRVLEVRIHGIGNNPPAEILGVDPADVRADQTDESGGFFIATRVPDDPADPAHPPDGVRREAYSWGLLARYGGGALGIVGQFFVQLAWLLILPFGLCNTAYWTREVPDQKGGGEWRAGRGAASLRVFALGLTLLYVCALASVSLDLIGTQCLGSGAACPSLPGWVGDFFGTGFFSARGARLALMSLVPVLGVLLLFALSHSARMRYEAGIFRTVVKMRSAGQASGVDAPDGETPAGRMTRRPLASEGFWAQTRVGLPTELLHLASAFFLLALLLGWDRVFAPYTHCTLPGSFALPGACVGVASGPIAHAWWIALGALAGLLGLAFAVIRIARAADAADRTETRRGGTSDEYLLTLQHRRERVGGMALVAGILVYGYVAVCCSLPYRYPHSARTAFVGLIAAPSIILGVLLAISFSALGWRRRIPRGLSIALVTVAGVSLLVAVALKPPRGTPVSAAQLVAYGVAALAVVALILLIILLPVARRQTYAYQGWRGTGPGVLMLLSLGGAMLLSTLLVLGVQSWLASGSPPCGCVPVLGGSLVAPLAYSNFGATVPVVGVLLLLLALVVAMLRMRTVPQLTTPTTRGGREVLFPLPEYPDGRVPVRDTGDKLGMRMLRARRYAALFHRGEPILGVLAVLLGLAIATSLTVPHELWPSLFDLAVPVLGSVAVLAVVAIAENALTTKERPIGIMWDVMCFLPRAGHPFGPPCYAERVVPELRDRVVAWLEQDDPGVERPTPEAEAEAEVRALTTAGDRKAIFSAHSLGAVLAVSCLFTLGADTQDGLKNIGLLTYGTQLRAFFGRFFPELFGPGPLGVRPCRGPSLWLPDPWMRQVEEDFRVPDDQIAARARIDRDMADPTLRQLLTQPDGQEAWINLWRRTDFLGFPDFSFRDNPIDAGADEFGPPLYLVKVATHPNYQASAQYVESLRALMARL
jgi:hypothetical protein